MPSKIKLLSLCALALSACATPHRMHTAQTAPEVYHNLSSGERGPFAWGYEYGKADEVKTLYHAMMAHPGWLPPLAKQQEEAAKDDGVKRGYEPVWIPPGVQPDGTQTEGHYINVEVVR
jgi:hypothetical protein